MSSPISNTNDKIYHKSNYDKVLKYIVPSIYYEQDEALKLSEIDIIDQLINCQLRVIGNITDVIDVSSIEDTVFSDINTAQGISQFFIKQNKLTDLTPNDFEKRILVPLGRSYSEFKTLEDFEIYLEEILLPSIQLNIPTADFLEGGTQEQNHIYLINNLSWFYFLNFSNEGLSYSPSSYVKDILSSKFYYGNSVQLNDAMRGLATYVWENYQTCSLWQELGLLPNEFRPATFIDGDSFTTGKQQLSKLLTLIDVLYSPLYLDFNDTRLKDAIDDYLINGYQLEQKILNGPFIKLMKAFSFAFADYSNNIDRLEILYDLKRCPDELLPHLADLIGWKLFGRDPERWRLQIANAVDIYKTTGTKKCIQFVADSILGQEVFDVSSNIYELWESYIPYLIYYSIATESSLFKDRITWTPDLAASLNITNYSETDFDLNIRSCVDEIIYRLVINYPNNFYFGGSPFRLGDLDFTFNYRNRNFPIPPFEEIPYYVNIFTTDNMIYSLMDTLVCFGVSEEFSQKVGSYIRNNIFEKIDDISIKNGWLFFTSSVQYPPNWSEVIKDISNTKVEYLPLWNGKSSHFKVIFDASGFDFAKTSLEADSGESLDIAMSVVRDFSPAHSIPDILIKLNEEDDNSTSNTFATFINIGLPDPVQLLTASSAGQGMVGVSALAMSTYKRGLTATSVATFSRDSADELGDALLSPDGQTASLPRRAHRRRDLKNIFPKEGFYSRSGNNQPVPWDIYTNQPRPDLTDLTVDESNAATLARNLLISNQPVLYLGLIPSSQDWVHISDYNNIPDIYDICENLNSSSNYSGLYVSNTFPVRGWRKLGSNVKIINETTEVDRYLDRGQLDPFAAAIHYIKESSKLVQASSYYYKNPEYFDDNSNWMNVLASYANSSTEFSSGFPNSINDYYNFELGRDFHKLYYEYAHTFQRHPVSPTVLNLDGPTIISHAFGPLIYNSTLEKTSLPAAITYSLDDIRELNYGESVFSLGGVISSGSYIASSILDFGNGIREYRSSSVLDHIELCQTSGSSEDNSFTIINLNNTGLYGSRKNSLTHNHVLIKQKSINGFGRIIFDLSKYQTPSDTLNSSYYAGRKNFLSPEHDFEFSLRMAISDESALNLGGGTVGVWIHTKPENGKVWSYLNGRGWVLHDASGITKTEVIYNYSNLFNLARKQKETESPQTFRCAQNLNISNPNRSVFSIGTLIEEDFETVSIKFHTKNKETLFDSSYGNQVHRLDQNYVVEVFQIPVQNDKFSLYFDFNMIDLTLNKWTKPLIDGIPNGSTMGNTYCKEFRVDVPKDKVLSILKYFNHISNVYATPGYSKFNKNSGLASRDKTKTQTFYEAEGGSRINYVESPNWNVNTKNSTTQLIENLTIIN